MSPERSRRNRDDASELAYIAELQAIAPGLHAAQNAWLSQIDSLQAPDRKTHELIRMVCSVIARHGPGVRHHAMLAAEVGASWGEIVGAMYLTEPAFGMLAVVEAMPAARRGYERGMAMQEKAGGSRARHAGGISKSRQTVKAATAAARVGKAAKSVAGARRTRGRPS